MNIKIMTVCCSLNKGAFLQCYALSKFLTGRGHAVKLIYIPEEPLPKGIMSVIPHAVVSFFSAVTRRRFLPEIISDPEKFVEDTDDLYIVGSDQIWNPDITGNAALNYFFDYLPEQKKRIAYAASFGRGSWDFPEYTENVRKLLRKFSGISVREESGRGICRHVFGAEAERVLDPTLLIDDYSELLPDSERRNAAEVVGFKFAKSEKYFETLADIAEKLHCTAVDLGSWRFRRGYALRPCCDARAWLRGIANARFVLTDSFHGMVFSIIFRKNFAVMPSYPERATRMLELAGLLNLKHRFYADYESLRKAEPWNEGIDFDETRDLLAGYRKSSVNFLNRFTV